MLPLLSKIQAEVRVAISSIDCDDNESIINVRIKGAFIIFGWLMGVI